MHEMSLALEVCRIAEEQVGAARLGAVREVAIEVGDDAGLDPGSFEFCLEALLGAPPFGSGRPVLQRVQGSELRVLYLEVDDDRPPD